MGDFSRNAPDGTARRLRVYVAGSWAAPITNAVQLALVRDPRVVQVGLDLDDLDGVALRESAADILISAAHTRIIRAPELAVPLIGSIGIHPSLLPRYRGSHPLWWALKNGEREVGVTIYELAPQLDAGAILAQQAVRVSEDDTFESLYEKTVRLIPSMVAELFTSVLETGQLPEGRPQEPRLATYFRTPTRRDTVSMRLTQAARRVRAGFAERVGRSRGSADP